MREKVNEELEKLRQNKTIGKSLEAEIEIMVSSDGADAKILRKYESSLAEIFIVSAVKIVEGKFETLAVQANKAEGERRRRCRMFLCNFDENCLFSRCRDAMSAANK